jgi:hypothetical protein
MKYYYISFQEVYEATLDLEIAHQANEVAKPVTVTVGEEERNSPIHCEPEDTATASPEGYPVFTPPRKELVTTSLEIRADQECSANTSRKLATFRKTAPKRSRRRTPPWPKCKVRPWLPEWPPSKLMFLLSI